jgi:hypothetical protein
MAVCEGKAKDMRMAAYRGTKWSDSMSTAVAIYEGISMATLEDCVGNEQELRDAE